MKTRSALRVSKNIIWHHLPTPPHCVVEKLGKEGQLFPWQKALEGEILLADLKGVSVCHNTQELLLTSLDAARVVMQEGCCV